MCHNFASVCSILSISFDENCVWSGERGGGGETREGGVGEGEEVGVGV